MAKPKIKIVAVPIELNEGYAIKFSTFVQVKTLEVKHHDNIR